MARSKQLPPVRRTASTTSASRTAALLLAAGRLLGCGLLSCGLLSCGLLSVGLLGCGLLGCGEEPAPPVKRAIPTAWEAEGAHERPPERQQRRKQKRYGQPVHVYVDGKFITVIKYRELPPTLEAVYDRHEEDGNVWYQSRFAWSDFFNSIDVDPARIREAHFHGGRAVVSIVKGSEIVRTGKTFGFSFTRGKGGKARMEFPPKGIEKNTWVDKLRVVAVYVDKEPPTMKQGSMHLPNGKKVPFKLTAYSDGEKHGGTRVYLDGRFQGSFRRRALKQEMLVDPAKPDSPYSLSKTLTSFGIDLAKVKLAHFIDPGDKIMSEQLGAVLRDEQKPLKVLLQPKSRGRIRIESLGSKKVESILLYDKAEPPNRQPPGDATPGASSSAAAGQAPPPK